MSNKNINICKAIGCTVLGCMNDESDGMSCYRYNPVARLIDEERRKAVVEYDEKVRHQVSYDNLIDKFSCHLDNNTAREIERCYDARRISVLKSFGITEDKSDDKTV